MDGRQKTSPPYLFVRVSKFNPFPIKSHGLHNTVALRSMYYLTLEESLRIREIFFGRLDPILPLITALQASGVKKGSLEISVISWPRARPVFCFFRETASWFEIHSQLSVVWFRRRRAGKAREQQPEFQSEATARRFHGKKTGLGRKHAPRDI